MSEKKTDWTGDGGELDYDALLAHYQDTIKPEPPPPQGETKAHPHPYLRPLRNG